MILKGNVKTGFESLNVMIVCWELGQVTESFIQQHIERLPCNVSVFEWNQRSDPDTQVPRRRVRFLKRTPPNPPKSKERFLQSLTESPCDVILAETGILGATIVSSVPDLSVPLVTQFFGVDAYAPRHVGQDGKKYDGLFKASSEIVCVSNHMVRQLVKLGATPERTHYVQSFVDPSQFDGCRPESAAADFLAVSRFVEKKAPIVTLMAFRETCRQHPEAKLTMVGDGPLLPACRQFVKASGMTDHVRFTGAMPHDDLPEMIQSSRAFVQHSVVASDNDHEGTPVIILEAQVSGLPVVSTRHAGIRDVVVEGETGFLVDEFDVDGMAQQMLKLAQQPQLAASMGAKARAHMIDHFHFDNTLGKLAAVLNQAANESKNQTQNVVT